MGNFNVKWQYPYNPDYDYEARLERINLDDERRKDLSTDNGFIIDEPQAIKKDLKAENGIFSTKFGATLQDVNPFGNRYSCQCKHLQSRIYHGTTCPVCGTKVKFVDDNFSYFGWICLKDPYYIIHPNLYKSLEFLIGADRLNRIIEPVDEKDVDGFSVETKKPKDEPFFGLGLIEFKENFREILDYYLSKNPAKQEYYDDILANKDKLFIQSIPVYTTHLRPFRVEGDSFFFEGTNAIYNLMAKHAAQINRDNLKMFRKKKPKNKSLYDLQTGYNELYKEMEQLVAQKKGTIRQLLGGRYNFTARSVIVPNPKLRIDQVTLPYHALVELLQQRIINILQKSYNFSYSDAYKMWYKSQIKKNERVYQIIKGIIHDTPHGLPIIINRNPTISYGSIMQMYCIDINDNFTMNVPLQILKPLAADFDGDCLNIMYIINQAFLEQAERVFNPRNAMYISRNDGMFNNDVNHCRDTLINANSLLYLSRDNYSPEQLERIRQVQKS